MASTSTPTQNVSPGEACVLLPTPPGRQLPDGGHESAGIGDVLRSYATLAGQAVEVARHSMIRTYHRARIGTVENYSRATRKAQDTAARTWTRASDLKRQHPLGVLAVIAGAAFVAGAVTRIWRSRAL
jgi:hypothetical protein